MFDIAPSEFLLVAFIALVVIGPKDLPKAMRVIGYWVGRARAVGRQFRSGFDEMVREAELAEMEKKWKAENERIMREHATLPADAAAVPALPASAEDGAPVMVAQPQLIEHPHVAASEPAMETSISTPGGHDADVAFGSDAPKATDFKAPDTQSTDKAAS
ncbi:Sec-independent protein translocase protein TatB [Sphingomonas sp. Mn802worker]|uniref:Sec-independent protein translocase protein TatB n=1 Tax=Sphingomonas sp. Mn802worker TaxID=629773 RepID=UPI00037F8BEE|nr:Sec-independent protein translocase protein TatB [Sphingomonas sp. Mn802worker]